MCYSSAAGRALGVLPRSMAKDGFVDFDRDDAEARKDIENMQNVLSSFYKPASASL